MKMSILEIGYKNIRKIKELKLSFINKDGSIIKNNFIMMANGTGKTTTMTLIKGLLDGNATKWSVEEVRSFAPTTEYINEGEFNISVKFDNEQYTYFLILNYESGIATIKTTRALAKNGGYETGRSLPEAISRIFTEEFVRRFVFDGEQAVKSMDSSSNEAEETIRYLYRLDKLDEIIALNQQLLIDVQNTEGNKGSSSSINNLRTRQKQTEENLNKLKKRRNNLKKGIKEKGDYKEIKEEERRKIDQKFERLNEEKNEIIRKQGQNKKDIDAKIAEIIYLTKSPYLLSEELCNRMHLLGNCMTKLKLPKTISKDFFIELANSTECVCGRCISKAEKAVILTSAERYLGSDQQAVLNVVKSSLLNSKYDNRLSIAFEQLKGFREETNRLLTLQNSNEEKLLKAGGQKAEKLQEQIDKLSNEIAVMEEDLRKIESTDESDELLTEKNNIHKAYIAYRSYEEKIAVATRTNKALRRKEIVEKLVNEIKEQATAELKSEIIRKANEKLRKAITDDDIEIESIDQYIKLKGRGGASEGQTLSIAYCFLGTLFEDAELEFPFVIDSPTGKMDFDKREAVANIIPKVFNQMIAFVQPAEVERFADRFYKNTDTQYLTIIASQQENDIKLHEGIEFFDSYQREHKGDEK